jgi:two-component system, cell cycle response regulator
VRSGKPLSALVLDIDYFKSVNDTYGHDSGDDVLREFARRLRKAVRGIDLLARFGGEEFVVVMPETDMGTAYAVADRLRERIADIAFPIAGRTREIPVTVSIGLASVSSATDTPEALLKRADEALYRAKREGRNRVVAEAA